jgi:GMP synthase (glutamine-hydrolysing)
MVDVSKPIIVFEVWIPGTTSGLTSSELTLNAVLEAGAEAVLIDARAGGTLPDYRAYCAAIIPGSNSMVTDRETWSENLAAWIHDAHAGGLPMLGICYGHQLLAHALHGEVDYLEPKPEMGTVAVTLLEAAASDDLLHHLPNEFPAQASHFQSVRRLPDGAVNLAQSEAEPHHAFRVGASTWGLQFHPELDTNFMKGLLDRHRAELESANVDVDDALSCLAETQAAASVISRFVDLVTQRQSTAA